MLAFFICQFDQIHPQDLKCKWWDILCNNMKHINLRSVQVDISTCLVIFMYLFVFRKPGGHYTNPLVELFTGNPPPITGGRGFKLRVEDLGGSSLLQLVLHLNHCWYPAKVRPKTRKRCELGLRQTLFQTSLHRWASVKTIIWVAKTLRFGGTIAWL